MDDPKQKGLLSQLIPDDIENQLGLGGEGSAEQQTRIAALLKAAAGQAGGEVENEINEFFGGRGALHETTRAAVTRGGKSAVNEVAEFLTRQLKLAAPLAKLIAPLLIQFFPAIEQIAGAGSTEKPKKKRRKKKKEESSAKPRKPRQNSSSKPAASSKPKPKPKPKPTSSGKPRKPKPSSSAKPRRKKPKRTLAIDLGAGAEEG